jgi:hypothetical protein
VSAPKKAFRDAAERAIVVRPRFGVGFDIFLALSKHTVIRLTDHLDPRQLAEKNAQHLREELAVCMAQAAEEAAKVEAPPAAPKEEERSLDLETALLYQVANAAYDLRTSTAEELPAFRALIEDRLDSALDALWTLPGWRDEEREAPASKRASDPAPEASPDPAALRSDTQAFAEAVDGVQGRVGWAWLSQRMQRRPFGDFEGFRRDAALALAVGPGLAPHIAGLIDLCEQGIAARYWRKP